MSAVVFLDAESDFVAPINNHSVILRSRALARRLEGLCP
jgi:hypothetical protein